MDKKVIFIDVDGTLYQHDKAVSLKNVQAIQEARKNGHFVFICTGRNLCSISKEIINIGFDGIVCSAGGHVEVEGTEIHSSYIPSKTVHHILDIFNRNKMEYALEATKHTFMSKHMADYFLGDITNKPNSEKARLIEAIHNEFTSKSMDDYQEEHIHKISFVSKDEASLEEPRKLLEKDFFFVIHELSETITINGEIILKKTNKATGIMQVLDFINKRQEDTIGIGDSMNDYQMIEYVAYGIAVGNACQALKNISDMVARDAKDDAIYHVFKEMGII